MSQLSQGQRALIRKVKGHGSKLKGHISEVKRGTYYDGEMGLYYKVKGASIIFELGHLLYQR